MRHYLIASLFTSASCLWLAMTVFIRDYKNLGNRILGFFNLSLGVWAFCYALMITASDQIEGLFWARGLHLPAILLPVLFVHFALFQTNNVKKNILRIGYTIYFLLSFILYTKFFVVDVQPLFQYNFFIVPGKLYHFFTIFFFIGIIYSLVILYLGYKKTTGIHKNLLKYLFLAYSCAFIGGASSFLPLFQLKTPFWGLYFIPLGMMLISYAVIQSDKIKAQQLRKEVFDREKAEEKDKIRTEFISHIAHELKTPLAILVGNTEILTEELEMQDSSLITYALQTQQSAYRLANHVDRIIKAAKSGEEGEEINLELYDYVKVITDTFALFENKAKDENITYALERPDIERLVVQLDAIKIEEILMNLIQNAFKFTSEGGSIKIVLKYDGTKVYTEVVDTGKGIPSKSIPYIFDRMYQVEDVLSKSHGGMGLGLFICRKNVEYLGGKINVNSIEGEGTTFHFSLPLYTDQRALVKNSDYSGPDRRAESRRSGEERRVGVDRRAKERLKRFVYVENLHSGKEGSFFDKVTVAKHENKNPGNPAVLIVEDTPAITGLIINALGQKYNLFMAGNGLEALEKLTKYGNAINLILSDVMMPKMNGFDLCEKVMAHDAYKHIPFVLITALKEKEQQLKGYHLGVTDYITKPFNIKILQEKVDSWIEKRRQEILLKDLSFSLENKVHTIAKLKDILLHELRNPLQVLNGGIYFLQKLKDSLQEQATEQQRKWLKNVDLMADGVEFLKSVLNMSKQLEENALVNKKIENVADIFDSTITQTEHLLKNISFEIRQAPILANHQIACVKYNLTQVFVNIIRNSCEAIAERNSEEEGSILVDCYKVEGDKLEIKIIDNGAGIAMENMPSVFKHKFTTKNDGSGIGLHFCKKLVELHEGRIMVNSQLGKGTIFTIILPLLSKQS